MKNVIILMIAVIGLTACEIDTKKAGEKDATQVETAPAITVENQNKVTSLEGQIFYTDEELASNREPDRFGETIGGYNLDGLRIYLVGTHKSYKVYPDFEGIFEAYDIEPGTYKLYIKSYENFVDEGGEFTYEFTTNIRVKKGEHTILPLMHVKKTYYVDLSKQEEVQ